MSFLQNTHNTHLFQPYIEKLIFSYRVKYYVYPVPQLFSLQNTHNTHLFQPYIEKLKHDTHHFQILNNNFKKNYDGSKIN